MAVSITNRRRVRARRVAVTMDRLFPYGTVPVGGGADRWYDGTYIVSGSPYTFSRVPGHLTGAALTFPVYDSSPPPTVRARFNNN